MVFTTIAPANLILDVSNPRLVTKAVDEDDALKALAGLLEDKLAVLAEHITHFGIGPDPMYVIELGDDSGRYVVLEGNRRLAAIRTLEAPANVAGVLSSAAMSVVKKAGAKYLKAGGLSTVPCTIFRSREEARPWIELRHTGENGGAGTVRWDPDEQARFNVRQGGHRPQPHTQALDFLQQQGALDVETRAKVNTTSVQRLLSSPAVRQRLGVDIDAGVLKLMTTDTKAVAKALMHVIDDLVTGRLPVKRIYNKEDREKYAKELPASVVVKPTLKPGAGIPAVDGSPDAEAPGGAHAKRHKRKKPRDRMIPGDCRLSIPAGRCRDIEEELRRLSLDKHTNGVSVLFRVFIELSCDVYIKRHKITTATRDSNLAQKLKATSEDLAAKDKLPAAEKRAVVRFVAGDSFLAPGVTLWNQYVHNEHVFPSPTDLRNHWNSLQAFIVALWA